MIARRLLLALGLAYAVLCVAVSTRYRGMLYPAPATDEAPLPYAARELTLSAADGVPVKAIEFPRRGSEWMVVYFHGNGEVVGSHVALARDLARHGFGLLLVEYRGYGRSRAAGPPTEEGLYADASAALDHLLREGIGPRHVALWGFSLGTGVASEMAYRGRGGRLILEAPYTSIAEVAARRYRAVPASWVVSDRFDTASKAKKIRIPTLLFHGDQDRVIPASMPARLNRLFPDVQLAEIEGGDHADLLNREGSEWLWRTLVDFIERGNAPVLRRTLATKGAR